MTAQSSQTVRQPVLNHDGGSSQRENTQQKVNEGTALNSYIQHQTGQQNSSNAKVSASVTKMANGNIYQTAGITIAANVAVAQNGQ